MDDAVGIEVRHDTQGVDAAGVEARHLGMLHEHLFDEGLARREQFLRRDGRVFRRNEIWRRVIDRRTGEQVGDELVRTNCALVVYEPGPDVEVIDVD